MTRAQRLADVLNELNHGPEFAAKVRRNANPADHVVIAYTDEDERKFDPNHSTVTYLFRVLPNNNAEHPKGFAPLAWNQDSQSHDQNMSVKSSWCRQHLSYKEARAMALAEIEKRAKRFIGDWNIRVKELTHV